MDAQASGLAEALSRFYSYLESERRYSPHTLSAYRRDIQAFLDYCDANDVKAWSDIDEPRVRQFVAKQHRKGLSGRSLQRQLSALRTLFTFLCRHQLATNNPAKDVPAPKSPRRLPNTLGVDQLNNLLSIPGKDALACRWASRDRPSFSRSSSFSRTSGLFGFTTMNPSDLISSMSRFSCGVS